MQQSAALSSPKEAKTPEGVSRLQLASDGLCALAPTYMSVTSGTDGAAPERTYRMVGMLRARLGPGADIAPHLTCVGSSRDEIRRLLAAYRVLEVRRLVLIRGDFHHVVPAEHDDVP